MTACTARSAEDPEPRCRFTLRGLQATATWVDDEATRRRIWDLFRTTPAPLGYDPAGFWPGGWSHPRFALLRLDPTMIEVTAIAAVSGPRLRWRTGNHDATTEEDAVT